MRICLVQHTASDKPIQHDNSDCTPVVAARSLVCTRKTKVLFRCIKTVIVCRRALAVSWEIYIRLLNLISLITQEANI